MHAGGAFLILVYAHIFRGLYYGSSMEPRQHLWWSGALIYVLMMAKAFIGYVLPLPLGQMSFWGAFVGATFVHPLLNIVWGRGEFFRII